MAGALGAIGTGSASVLTSCAGGGESAAANKPLKEPGTYYIPELPDKATDGKELKAGVIGCGGRGSGAAENFLDAANGVTVVAVADTFKERVDALADKLKEKGWSTYGGQNSDAMKLLNLYFTSGAYAQTKGEKGDGSI